MSSSVQNALSLIRNVLMSDSNITDLVLDRVHNTHFYDFDNGTVEYPLIILDNRAGAANYSMASQSFQLNIYVYSMMSIDECFQIYSNVYSALNATRLHAEHISAAGYLVETGRPINGFNSESKSYFVMAQYQVYTAG